MICLDPQKKPYSFICCSYALLFSSLVAQHHDVARALSMLRHGPCGPCGPCYKLACLGFKVFAQHLTALKRDEARQTFQFGMTTEGCFINFWFIAPVEEPLEVVERQDQAYEEVKSLAHCLHAATGSLFQSFFPDCRAKGSHFTLKVWSCNVVFWVASVALRHFVNFSRV